MWHGNRVADTRGHFPVNLRGYGDEGRECSDEPEGTAMTRAFRAFPAPISRTGRTLLFGYGIRASLTLLTMIVAFRRYGLIAMMTGKRMKHAAKGRAKRSMRRGHTCAHSGRGVTDQLPASLLLGQLQASRQRQLEVSCR